MYIPFSDWLPDRFDLNNPGVEVAKNCLPSKDGFQGFPGFVRESGNAIAGNAKGMISTEDASGTPFTYVGDESALYRYKADFTFEDISKVGGYTNVQLWEATVFDDLTIFTGYNDSPQVLQAGVDAVFRDLGGSPPQAKYCATVRDQVLLANVIDSNGAQPTRIWHSARNLPENPWVADPATQCGFFNIPDSGPLTGLAGGAFGIALTTQGVHRLTYAGSPQIYQRDEIGNGIGCKVPGSVIRRMDARGLVATVAFLGNDGFCVTGGQTVTQIANDRVNEWFFDNFDPTRAAQMAGGVFGLKDCYLWTFPSINAADQNDLYIAFSFANSKFAYGELDVEIFGQTESPVRLVDDIDELVDNITHLVDSAIWDASTSRFGAIDHEGYFGTFVGPTLIPEFETGDLRPIPNRKCRIGRIHPNMDGFQSTQVASGDNARQLGPFGPASTLRRGFTSHRATCKSNNVHRIKVQGTNAFRDVSGMEVEVIPGGN